MNTIKKIRDWIESQRAFLPTVGYSTQVAEEFIPVQNFMNYLLSFLDTLEENQEIDHQERFDKIISLMKESHKENRCFFESDDIKYLESLLKSNN